jgi:hypothetical protein
VEALVMTKIEVTLSAEYGIMFIHDSKEAPVVPSNAGELPVTSTTTCVAFTVLGYVDGDAKIILACGEHKSDYQECFAGEIVCPSKSLSLTDSNGFAFASVPLADDHARISLRMSEERNPDLVECVIQNMMTF